MTEPSKAARRPGAGWARVRRPRQRAATVPPPVVYRWDLDKTYLKSDFESLRKMMRVPFERAEDKIDEPGVVALMRALRASARAEGRRVFVYFVSASPPQIGRAIREKLALDGVEIDGIVFKDQLQHLVRGRFRFLREQIGFKLAELLKARLAAPAGAAEYLFGDDWESDSLCYSLYADVVSGRLDHQALGDILVRLRIDPARLVEIRALARRIADRRRRPPHLHQSRAPHAARTLSRLRRALRADLQLLPDRARPARRRHGAARRGGRRRPLADRARRPTRAASSAIRSTIWCGAGISSHDDAALRRDLEEAGRPAVDGGAGQLVAAALASLATAAAAPASRRVGAAGGRRRLSASRRRLARERRPAWRDGRVTRTVVVLSTAGSREEAERIATALVDERLAACVNLVAPLTSIYRWQGAVERASEVLLVIKTRRTLVPRLIAPPARRCTATTSRKRSCCRSTGARAATSAWLIAETRRHRIAATRHVRDRSDADRDDRQRRSRLRRVGLRRQRRLAATSSGTHGTFGSNVLRRQMRSASPGRSVSSGPSIASTFVPRRSR